MKDVVREFFGRVAGPHPTIPRTISGKLRFELDDRGHAEHWLVTFNKGEVSTAESDVPADCVVKCQRGTLEAIIEGRTNAMAALLRGAITVEGQVLLLSLFRGLFTAPAAEHESTRVSSHSGRR